MDNNEVNIGGILASQMDRGFRKEEVLSVRLVLLTAPSTTPLP